MEITNPKLKLKDIPKKFEWDKWEDFALSFNGYKFAGDISLSNSRGEVLFRATACEALKSFN